MTTSPSCTSCGTELPPTLLACPKCGSLVHSEQLKRIAAEASRAETAGNLHSALTSWREALGLLPPSSAQYQTIFSKVQTLSTSVTEGAPRAPELGAPPTPAPKAGGKQGGKWLAGLGVIGLFLSKFKFAILFILTKGKLLLTGLFQAKTFLSMGATVLVYMFAFGWKFAVGLVLSIYIHEMGHVASLRRYGIPATAPMFIPGFGAFVRLNQRPATAAEDARIGLAGPVWGTCAAAAALVLGQWLDSPIWLAIAHVGAYINLFNLLPIWQLDGGRGFAALSRRERGMAAAGVWALTLTHIDGMLIFLAIAATVRVFMKGAPERGDRNVLLLYLGLVAALTFLLWSAPLPTRGEEPPKATHHGRLISS